VKVKIKIKRMSEKGATGLWRKLLKPAMAKFHAAKLEQERQHYADLIAQTGTFTNRWMLEHYPLGVGFGTDHISDRAKQLTVLAPGEKAIADKDEFLWTPDRKYYLQDENHDRIHNEAWLDQELVVNPDCEKIFLKRAAEATERQFGGFIAKQSDKIWGVLGDRGVEISGFVNDENCWEAYLTFKLSDGSKFDIKCQLTYHYDGSPYQSPTTFHNVVAADGTKVEPSEAKVKSLLGTKVLPLSSRS
jgi:hypothetical protein